MLETLRKIFPPTPRYSKRAWYEWSTPFDPMLADLQPNEHGIIRQLSSEAISRNGLDLTFEDHGFSSWRAS